MEASDDLDALESESGKQIVHLSSETNPIGVEIPSDSNQESTKQKSSTNRAGRYIIRDLTDSVDLGLLPEGWIRLRHTSGLTLYFHRPTRVVTLSRPYSVGSGSVRYHRIPVSAIPCLAYRKACEQDNADNTGIEEAITQSVRHSIRSDAFIRLHLVLLIMF
ncbi:hypothetical protein EG68_03001 [Paragonimus skrjabini miyazakii]|uniref:WW domain-containing protein n=1 Tax=Paragonimus skrjabini miyazakii TaxID=59628 RepID=A0A8S9YYS1_9TREM|nr:hypothetical protein EG68_03001 [Paragonimus skrjabini miyazakii]